VEPPIGIAPRRTPFSPEAPPAPRATRLPPPLPPVSGPVEPEAPPQRWRWLAAGIAIASVSHLFLPRNFIWVLCALPHEMGHATIGCLLGHPSAPAISLGGHAWTGIGELRVWLVWVMAAAAAGGAWTLRHQRIACALLAGVALLIPALAFAHVSEVLISAGGHLGELAFAAYCYQLCWTGGHTDTPKERVACAMAGALVQSANVSLCWGLLNDAAARAHYATSGSLGLKNDMLVLAEDLLHCRLSSVALPMLLIALAALPLGLLIGWWRARDVD
jgi:hypothetical protein